MTQLKNRRRALGLMQWEMAELCGVAVSSISHWENGRNVPTLPNMRQIAAVLHVPVAKVIRWCEEEK